MVQPPEICDDCNAVGGDGCDSSGTVEQGWLCATAGQACLHFSGVSSVNGGVISAGGSGGTAFDEACPFGSALVGFDGDWDGTDLKRLRGHCGAMFATSTGSVQWSTSTPTAYYGNQDQALGNIDCPTTHFVVGFDVNFKSTGGMQVGGFKLKCATLGFDGQGMVTGAPQTLAQYSGLGGTTQSPSCPQGQVAVRFTGRAGGKFDRLGATCASLTPTFCGDGTMSGFESCDDGNAVSGDGCSTLCQTP